jgi:hypothetical protein
METQPVAREEAIEGVERVTTPHQAPLRTWAGHGTGATCNSCGCAIHAHEIEYEIELATGDTPTLHFHFVCYRSWQSQRGR